MSNEQNKTSDKEQYYLVFCEQAPNGIVCRAQDLKHWEDVSSYKIEIDSDMVDTVNNALDNNTDFKVKRAKTSFLIKGSRQPLLNLNLLKGIIQKE